MALQSWSRPFDWSMDDDVSQFLTDMLPSRGRSRQRSQNDVLQNQGYFFETPKDYHLQLDLPGVSPNDLDVSIVGGNLRIKAERRSKFDKDLNPVENDQGQTISRYQRTLPIPTLADVDNVVVRFDQGVLDISMPKREEESIKKLEIAQT